MKRKAMLEKRVRSDTIFFVCGFNRCAICIAASAISITEILDRDDG